MTVRKEDRNGKRLTQKGAIHIHGKVYKSRKILPMTPAQYRHFHFGALKGKK